jgi:hypothetical protein
VESFVPCASVCGPACACTSVPGGPRTQGANTKVQGGEGGHGADVRVAMACRGSLPGLPCQLEGDRENMMHTACSALRYRKLSCENFTHTGRDKTQSHRPSHTTRQSSHTFRSSVDYCTTLLVGDALLRFGEAQKSNEEIWPVAVLQDRTGVAHLVSGAHPTYSTALKG